ncbi:MAG: SusC/RagA family TonB-linked outer membrane protein, partial [Bacteroidales bacterium]|nr:SusC/RagA family TonB-linked outer membrane protein [Bacteroidales bacterium]
MKFKFQNSPFSNIGWSLKQTMRVLKISLVLILATCFQISARSYAQNVTLEAKETSLDKICMEIHRQTGYNFFYKNDCISKAKKITINLQDTPLSDALDACLAGQPIAYKITGKTVVLTSKNTDSGQQPVLYPLKGKVTDKSGSPISGVAVMVKNTNKGTTTDVEGNYTIEITGKEVLIFRVIGYAIKEVSVSGKTVINVQMEEEALELEETTFISTGYQKIRPEQSTGSLATIRARDFDTRVNTTDFLTGLQNKIPGLLINNDIQFEGNSLFQIRGISTINGNRTPLIVVDGYPTELSLDMIDPNEIESVTVLKDAAAATVYGVRASNGVIVVERKKARAGKVDVNFRTTLSFTPKENYERYRWVDDASNATINYFRNTSNISSSLWGDMNSPTYGGYFYSYPPMALILAQQKAGVITEEEANQQFATLGSYNNTKDYERLFLRTASTQTYNLDMSGGDERVLYYLTTNYSNINASQIKNDNSQFRLSGRSTLKLSDRFSLDLTTDFQEAKTTSVPIPDINNIYPYERFQDENGNPLPLYNGSYINPYYNQYIMSLGLPDNMYYPLVEINEVTDKSRTVSNRITANFRYNIGKGFNFNFGGVYEYSKTDTKHFASENSSEVHQYINRYAKAGTNGSFTYIIPKGAFLKQQTSSTEGYTLRAQINYDKQIAEDHSLNLILGAEIRDVITKSNLASYFGYNDQTLSHQAVDYNSLLTTTYLRSNPELSYDNLFAQGYTENRFISGYSNLVYSYKGKYSFTGSIRVDQSNLFGTDPKYKYKPLWSVGAGWNIDKEKFMQDIEWVKSLKLRMSYGFNGNVAKNALPQVIAQSGNSSKINKSSPVPMLTLSSYANSGLRWEQTNNLNVGIDYTIFKGVSGNIDYYVKKSIDILATTQIDASKGGAFALVNQASIRNNGLEVNLHADWITRRDFNWNTGLVFAHNTSKVLDVYNSAINSNSLSLFYVGGDYSKYLKGYAVGSVFAYRYAGLNNTGNLLYYDIDGNAKEFSVSNFKGSEDLDNMGTIPSFNLGLSNRVDIGNFYVYCMINYYGGFSVRVPVPIPSAMRPLEGADNYWQEPGDEADPNTLPALEYLGTGFLNRTNKYIVNGAYFTLGDLTASYSFRNNKLVKKAKISNLEIKLQA